MNNFSLFIKKYLKFLLVILIPVAIWLVLLLIGFFNPEIRINSNITDSDFTIFNQDRSVEIVFNTPFKQKLTSGTYYIKANNSETYSELPKVIELKNSQEIDLNFEYSTRYYQEKFKEDRQTIHKLLKEKYPKTISEKIYTIAEGKFFRGGEYYATSIGFVETDEIYEHKYFFGNVYRVIFHKVNGVWKQVTHPQLLLSSLDYPDIPIEILKEVNFWNE